MSELEGCVSSVAPEGGCAKALGCVVLYVITVLMATTVYLGCRLVLRLVGL